jgi:Secretion system C-terminal sorting domain
MKTRSQIYSQKTLMNIALFWCNVAFAQIPNWNMETWTSIKDLPSNWVTYGVTSKVSPGQNGFYAIKLQGDNLNSPGSILYGFPTRKNGYNTGTPFNTRPDSMVAYFKYHISEGDAAWVIITTKKNGVQCSSDFYEYSGDNLNEFKRMSFKLNYTTKENPDTMFIAFTSTYPEAKIINNLSWVIIDNISFKGTEQNVPNADFENWTNLSTYAANGWQSFITTLGSNIVRTTDAYAGNYAMKLQSIIGNSSTLKGSTFTTGNNNSSDIVPSFAITSRPNSLKGFYKFIPQNGDAFYINIELFKNGQLVGNGNFSSPSAVNNYTPFSAEITYINSFPAGDPDSASISIATYSLNGNTIPLGQSVAFIDNLSFDRLIYSGIGEKEALISDLTVYPNPAQANVNIQFQLQQKENLAISILDLNGREVLKLSEQSYAAGNHQLHFDIGYLSNGMYFITIQNGQSSSHSKLMITN